jgi:hypothetical protein
MKVTRNITANITGLPFLDGLNSYKGKVKKKLKQTALIPEERIPQKYPSVSLDISKTARVNIIAALLLSENRINAIERIVAKSNNKDVIMEL